MAIYRVKLSEPEAHLSEHLRRVRRGHSLVVVDRDKPVAKVVRYTEGDEPVAVRAPLGKYPSVQEVPLPPRLGLDIDIVDLRLQDRRLAFPPARL